MRGVYGQKKIIAKLRTGSRRANDERKLEQHMWMV